jgi:microcystin-dependent protein
MPQPYVGEIKLFAGNYEIAGWAFCDGRLLPISEYETLFNLIGTTYGGDGQETFALPDLQSRAPIHMGNGFILAETGGVEEVTLTINQIPIHTHPLVASKNQASNTNPPTHLLGQIPGGNVYVGETADQPLAAQSIGQVGGSQPHENMQPYLVLNFIISLFGVFPNQ